MKTLITAATMTLAIATSFAQEATVFIDVVPSTTTRAEVRAGVLSAVASGERLSNGERIAVPAAAPESSPAAMPGRTRADVRAEVIAAMARGERLSYGERNSTLQHTRMDGPAAGMAAARGNDLR